MASRRTLEVLLLNLYFPPDTAATAAVFSDLVAAFVEKGHHVAVLTGRPSYDPLERRPWRPLQREIHRGAVVERIGSTALDRRVKGGRAANYISFVALAAVRALLRRRPDVVLVGSDPFLSVWVGLAVARGRPVVYSLQDLNPDAGVAAGLIKPKVTTRIWGALHRAALRRCSLVVCLGETMKERVRDKGVQPDRIAVVPNGAWPPEGEADPDVVGEIRGLAEFLVMHAGNLSVVGAWDAVVESAGLIERGSQLVFVGGGYEDRRLRESGVRLLPFRPKEQLPSLMAAGDLQVVSLKRGLEGLSVPSKVYAILAHGRPVLAVVPEDSEVAHLVRRWGCGLVANPDDPRDIASKIEWARSNPRELQEMARRAREAAREFDRGAMVEQFVTLVERTAMG